jgi:hypothetical protein
MPMIIWKKGSTLERSLSKFSKKKEGITPPIYSKHLEIRVLSMIMSCRSIHLSENRYTLFGCMEYNGFKSLRKLILFD